ncbi:hypothetical protein [Rhizobacter sp. LjRoot28]|uniref:hypothetical protein n=1 Tax=Rhizobacter sp. LjRoot28 TaxID=3342309 RepID=UPI003ED045F5
MSRLPSPSPAHRILMLVWVALALLWQPAGATARAAGMAAGQEVCTSVGMQMVDADGQPIQAQSHPCTDCCGSLWPAALLPGMATGLLRELRHATPASPPPPLRLAAEWLGPLSRGPPADA